MLFRQETKIKRLLVYFLLFFLPFIIFPFEISPYERPKVITAEITIQLLTLVAIFKYRFSLLRNLDKKFVTILLIILFLTALHLVFFANHQTLFGNVVRLQGIFLLWHLLLFSIIAANIKMIRIPAFVPISSAFLLTVFAIILNRNFADRAIATLGEPNALAATSIFIWPFIFFLRLNFLIKALAMIFPALIVLISKSESATVAFLLQTLIIVATLKFSIPLKKSVMIALAFLMMSFALPFLQKNDYENRSLIWRTSILAGVFNPAIGSGFGNAHEQIARAALYLNNFVKFKYVDSAHNIFLDWWIQGGLVGLATVTFLAIKTLLNIAQKGKTREALAFIGILTTMSFNPASVVTLVAFWWLVGQGFATKKTEILV